jgi:hypothetical protein
MVIADVEAMIGLAHSGARHAIGAMPAFYRLT